MASDMKGELTRASDGFVKVCRLDELEGSGVKVVEVSGTPVALFSTDGLVHAVDNRCPHMGFPLHRGTVKDGLLTCHWHQARFDLASGCTFDLFADDVPAYDVRTVGGDLLIATAPRIGREESVHRRRLVKGLEQNIGLTIAKSIYGLLEASVSPHAIAAQVAEFGSSYLPMWSEGLVRLGCVLSLAPSLSQWTVYLALVYAARQIAAEAASATPRRGIEPLDGEPPAARLESWLGQWTRTRHREGAERTLLTLARHAGQRQLASSLYGAACIRAYADGGHLLDFMNRAIDLAGELADGRSEDEWRARFLPMLAMQLTGARGGEESTDWHHPIEITAFVDETCARLEDAGTGDHLREATSAEIDGLVDVVLGEDPLEAIAALENAFNGDLTAESVSRAVAYAAAVRMARFSPSNDVNDWFNAQHTFIYAQAMHGAVLRSNDADVVRGVLHAAVSVYLDRFLNVPPARMPAATTGTDTGSADERLQTILASFDTRDAAAEAGHLVAAYLDGGGGEDRLIDTLAYATVREDLDFHSLQVLAAAVAQREAWLVHSPNDARQRMRTVFVAVARNLQAHCPTMRAGLQTATIARRLHRGEKVFAEEG